MAFIPTNASQVQQFAGALYGLTAGTQTMGFVLGEINRTSLDQVLNTYYTASFGRETTLAVSQRMVANLGITGDSSAAAVTYVNGLLSAATAANRGVVVKDILATFAGLTADATYGAAARAWVAKVDAALLYSGVADIPFSPAANAALPALTVAQDVITGSAGDDVFVARVVQNSLGDQTNTLGTGDVLTGGAGADALLADVVMAAPRTTTSGSITATTGPTSTSTTTVTASGTATNTTTVTGTGTATTLSTGSAIRPETRGIEFAHFTALENDQLSNNEVVMINAAKMLGLSRVGSVGSDASLTIYNLTTLTDSGAYADRRNTSSMTVRMDHSGNDSAFSADVESDMTVLFDQNYLLAGRSTTSSLEVRAVNNVALRQGGNPLSGVLNLTFQVAGQTVTVDLTTGAATTTYAGLRDKIAAQLTAQGIAGVTVTVQPLRESLFSDDVRIDATTTYARSSRAGDYNPILLSSTSTTLVPGQVKVDSTAQNANFLNTYVPVDTSAADPVTVQVQLHKVGRGGDGGDLTIGGMSTAQNLGNANDTNVWNAGSGAAGTFESSNKQGVAQFNMTVEGDATQPSNLASLQSTNNALRTVNVVAATGSTAPLVIGNRETIDVNGDGFVNGNTANANATAAANANPRDLTTTRNEALKDVKDFNASAFNNGVTLNAVITDESVAKYMNRTDRAPDQPATDNANFLYNFGTGNDSLNINISKANLAATGTTNREDFTFRTSTGAGNDTISAQIGNGTGNILEPWYNNMVGSRNTSIDGGAGNDTIRTYGSSAWSIVAGDGNDVVYTDNSGATGAANASVNALIGTNAAFNQGRATWVIAANDNIGDAANTDGLQSTVALPRANQFLYGASVRVVFSDAQSGVAVNNANGFEATAAISATTAGVVGVGNQLHINQAIKLAINSDATLSRLLIAEDGPGNTLVIRSLIDGRFNSTQAAVAAVGPDDLLIEVIPLSAAAYGAYGSAQQVEALSALRYVDNDNSATGGTAGADIITRALASATYINTNVLDNSTPKIATQGTGATRLSGENSSERNANSVNGGAGDDVIVLSTNVGSVETIVYSGADIGNDVIVNFFDDTLNFNAYLSNVVATTGASIAPTFVDQRVAAGAFEANNVVVTSFATLDAANPATTGLTFAGLTGAQVLTELTATTVAGTPGTGPGFTTGVFSTLVGAGVARKAVLMVENANLGQYKVFEVSFGNAVTNPAEDFTSVALLGQIDFGSTLAISLAGVSRVPEA